MLQGMARVIEALLESRRLSQESIRLALERQDALDEMARTQRLLQQAERMARIGSWRLELATGHVQWSDQTYAIHGLEPGSDEMLDHALSFYPDGDQKTSRRRFTLARTRAHRGIWNSILPMRRGGNAGSAPSARWISAPASASRSWA
jgi:hypothetical protein